QGVSVWEGAEEVQSIIHIKAEKCKNMKHSQDMQLIQKLRDDQKRMKKVFEVMSGRNIVTNSRVTPSWREIVSLTFSEAGVLHVNWISFGHCVSRRDRPADNHRIYFPESYLSVVQCDLCVLSGLSNVLNIILRDLEVAFEYLGECALSLDKLAMPPHLHRKFRMGVAIPTGCRGYYKPGTRAWVNRGSRKIRIQVDMYPCRVEERLTIKLVKGEEVFITRIDTTVTAKRWIQLPNDFWKLPGYITKRRKKNF
ncbi:hypothetical protein Tco_1074917, partial [Tanacetum coccineum]